MQEIATYFSVSVRTVGRAVKRCKFEDRCEVNRN
jgi:hypothetical protein